MGVLLPLLLSLQLLSTTANNLLYHCVNDVYYHCIFGSFTVQECQLEDHHPAYKNTRRDTNSNRIYTEVEYACRVGQKHPDTTDRASAYCETNLEWTFAMPPCIGKYKGLYFIFHSEYCTVYTNSIISAFLSLSC